MLICKKNDTEKRIEECIYNSSNVIYSLCNDLEDSFKTLEVVFSNGSRYLYKEVNVNDYVMFRNEESQGKALIKYISSKINGKPKYEYVRLSDIENVSEWIELKKKELLGEDAVVDDNTTAESYIIKVKEDDTFVIATEDKDLFTITDSDTKLSVATKLLDCLRKEYKKTYVK